MDAQAQERELDFQQVWQMFAETRAQFAETRAQIEATDAKLTRQFEATDAKLTRLFAETAAQFKETDKRYGDLAGKWGRFVEGLVAPAALRLFADRGIPLDGTTQRARKNRNGQSMEVDVLAVSSEYAVLIEVKSTLKVEDVQDHLRRLGKFKTFFPEYADRKVVGAVAGIVINEGADKFAYDHGLFVIVQSGEMVEIANDEQFRPRLW